MAHRRLLCCNNRSIFYLFSNPQCHKTPSQYRWINATSHLEYSWMDTIKGVFTGNKSTPDSNSSVDSFTLYNFADELGKARKLGTLKQFVVGRSSESTFADAFQKQEAILRYLGSFDPSGENLLVSQKQEAAKQCNCTVADVENTLAKFVWAKEAQKKLQKLKEEGKPMPKSMAEVHKLMGSTPLDLARSNMAQSGQISRNALCPCGSKKRYKRGVDVLLGMHIYGSNENEEVMQFDYLLNPLKCGFSREDVRPRNKSFVSM